jgi:anti-sigma regulatory factor (Ser/Thr protein kinase)
MSAAVDTWPRGLGAQAAELSLPAESSQLAVARRYIRALAADYGLDANGTYELEYAVNEAVTNAIQHGQPDELGRIHVSALASDDRLTIRVRDYGTFASPMPGTPLPDAESGRGLALMARFVDEVHVDIEPGATTIGLTKLRP